MTDREMLELAAKAFGLTDISIRPMLKKHASDDEKLVVLTLDSDFSKLFWNPLTDDCHALRLAAALKIDLDWQSTKDMPEPTVEAYRSSNDRRPYFCATEPEAGYRRAITRAAAEIGKAMQETTS